MRKAIACFLAAVLCLSLLAGLNLSSVAAETGFAAADGFVPGEEYVLTMNGTRMYFNGNLVSASTTYCVSAETYQGGMALAMPPATVAAGEKCLWRISYATTTNTVTLWSDYAGKYLNMSSTEASLSDTPQALNATISDGKIKIYTTVEGTNYYLRMTRGTATVHGRWVVGATESSTEFGLQTIQDSDSDTFVRPMRQFVSGEQYALGRASVRDAAGVTMDTCVVAAPKEAGLQYATRPKTLEKATDSLWRITENGDGTYVFYSDAAGKYLNLSATAATLSDTPQNLNVTLSGRKMKIYTVIDETTYYLRFSNVLTTGSGWVSGTLPSSNEFTLYTLQQNEAEYDNAGQTPLYSVACFSDLHVDYGIQSWNSPIRQGTVNAVNYLRDTLGGANVILVGGDIVSNNDWNAEWTNENLRNSMDTVYATLLQGSTDSVVLPITGNHDSEPGNTAGGTVYSGDWDSYLLEHVGDFDAYLRNPDSKFNELLCYRYSLNGMEFISVNTPYQPTGDVSTLYVSQAEWVAAQLEEIGQDKTVILQCHYPVSAGLDATNLLQETLAQYPNVLYCYGHVHGSDSEYAWYASSELVRPIFGSETQNEDNSWTTNGALSCHMGSMGYYNNQYQSGGLAVAEPLIVQFLKIDFYEDHITFRYYNTGEKSGDPDVYEIASYTVVRDMSNQLAGLNLPSENRDLTVNYQGRLPSDPVYSLDVAWENDDVSFDYDGGSEGTWKPQDHTFEGFRPAEWKDNQLKVTVVNHSNVGVKATLTVVDADADDDLTVTPESAEEILETAEEKAVADADFVDFVLTVNGTPKNGESRTDKVATATLTFAKADNS